jgi:hypothetical protein
MIKCHKIIHHLPPVPEHLIKQALFVDGKEFMMIDEVYMPLNTWVYGSTRIIHQPGNQRGERISIQVSFNEDVFELFGLHNNIEKEQQ